MFNKPFFHNINFSTDVVQTVHENTENLPQHLVMLPTDDDYEMPPFHFDE